jgi:hypothetical protein
MIKIPLDFISKLGDGVFKEAFNALKGGVTEMFKGLGSSMAKLIPSGLKGGTGIIGKLMGGIFKVLTPAMKMLKRIPLLGTIISLGFAISRFKSGDTVGGIIDVLSGLSGLVDMVVPGLGTTLSIGFDMLNAFLDVKAGGATPEASKKKGDILWDMAKSMGSWLWDNALNIPVLGTFKRFGMAGEAFGSGAWGEGLKQIGYGLISIIPGGGLLISGIEMLAGWFSSGKTSETEFKENSSWADRMKEWLQTKLQDLPYVLRKPLEWLGILKSTDDKGSTLAGDISKNAKEGVKSLGNTISGIYSKISNGVSSIVGGAKGSETNATKTAQKAFDGLGGSFTEEQKKQFLKRKDATQQEYLKRAWKQKVEDSHKLRDKLRNPTPIVPKFDSNYNVIDTTSSSGTKPQGTLAPSIKKLDENPKQQGIWDQLQSVVSGPKQVLSSDDKQTQIIHSLFHASKEQIKLLSTLVNIGTSSLQELKRVSGNKSSGGGTQVIQSPQPVEKTQKISVDNMRGGYSSSAYSLA